jgi:dUTP pyrophosphatase
LRHDPPIFVYLAEPIDRSDGDRRRSHDSATIFSLLQTWGYTVYRPAGGFRASNLDPRIEQVNRVALRQADILVAMLYSDLPSIGVPAEIEAATAAGTPAIVFYDKDSQALAGNPLVRVLTSSSELPGAIKQALADHPRPDENSLRLVIADGHDQPIRAYPDDAGIDLTTVREYVIGPGEFADVHTQVDAIQLPTGYWGMITGRSSTLRRHKLHVPVAVIDPGWRGPLFVGVWNLSPNPVYVNPGDRLGQLILIPNHPAIVRTVVEVEPAPRGLNGFGSSG